MTFHQWVPVLETQGTLRDLHFPKDSKYFLMLTRPSARDLHGAQAVNRNRSSPMKCTITSYFHCFEECEEAIPFSGNYSFSSTGPRAGNARNMAGVKKRLNKFIKNLGWNSQQMKSIISIWVKIVLEHLYLWTSSKNEGENFTKNLKPRRYFLDLKSRNVWDIINELIQDIFVN